MTITRHASAADFLTATEALRATEPHLTNVMASVATGVVAGVRYASANWLTLHAADGALVGMAMRTAPWNLWVSPMPTWAADELGDFVADEDPDTPGVIGPHEPATRVVETLTRRDGRAAHLGMTDVLRVLTDLHAPSPPGGAARPAEPDDIPLLAVWNRQFASDAELPAHVDEDALRQQVDGGALWLWEVDGRPVAMAGHARLVSTPAGVLARIGPVYTEPESRGHGYGSAITAAVVDALAPHCSSIMLFADAAKPGINAMYERLGFQEMARVIEVELIDG